MEIYKLDSIEDGIAALECPDGSVIYINPSRLPCEANEGDCFGLSEEGFVFLEEETENRRKRISSLLDSIISE